MRLIADAPIDDVVIVTEKERAAHRERRRRHWKKIHTYSLDKMLS